MMEIAASRLHRRGLRGRGGDDPGDDRRDLLDYRALSASLRALEAARGEPGDEHERGARRRRRTARGVCARAAAAGRLSSGWRRCCMSRLGAGDAARLPSALIGQAAPSLDLPGLDDNPGPRRFRSAPGPCHAGQHLRVLVPALPRRARISARARRRSRDLKAEGVARRRRAERFAREHPALSRRRGDPTPRSASTRRPRRHRLGRLRRARDFHRPRRRRDRLQGDRPDQRGHGGERRQAGDREGDEVENVHYVGVFENGSATTWNSSSKTT